MKARQQKNSYTRLYRFPHPDTHIRRGARSRSIVHIPIMGELSSIDRDDWEYGKGRRSRGEISLYTNESLVAIVRMEFRTVIKPIGVTSVSIGGLLTHSFSFSYLVIHHEMAVWKRYIFLQHSHIVLCCYLRQLIFLFSFFLSWLIRIRRSPRERQHPTAK